LGVYRELGFSRSGFTFKDFFENINSLFSNKSSILSSIAERFDNTVWLSRFWEIRSQFSMSLFDSIKGLIGLFIPASVLGGVKIADVDTYLTIEVLGSQAYGTYSFTAIPEWYLNFGLIGIPLMAFVSGTIAAKLSLSVSKVGSSIFFLVLYADGFFLKYPFVSINSFGNVAIIYHVTFAAGVYLGFSLFKYALRRERIVTID